MIVFCPLPDVGLVEAINCSCIRFGAINLTLDKFQISNYLQPFGIWTQHNGKLIRGGYFLDHFLKIHQHHYYHKNLTKKEKKGNPISFSLVIKANIKA